jgi:hypothetical protein
MNLSTEVNTETQEIEAYRVSDHARMGALPRHFGRHMMTVEGKIYDLMRAFSFEYEGGHWYFYELSNGGFYMAPTFQTLRLCIPSNGYDGEMTGDAAGITVSLFAYSHLSFHYRSVDAFVSHFYRLRDFALGHAESAEIFAAID